MSNERNHGYRPDLEDLRHLEQYQTKRDFSQIYSASYDRPLDAEVRERVKSLVVIESQARTNSCAGHAGSTVCEFNEYLETGDLKQLSRWACYIWGQRESGIRGDSGATIDGIARACTRIGACVEPLWKFTGSYHTSPPGGEQRAVADAANRKLSTWQVLKSYADIAQWLQTGQGGIVMGIPWYRNWSNIGRVGVMPDPSGGLTGYHAFPLLWTTSRKQGSRYYFEGPNSWGTQWGLDGWSEWSPSLIDWLVRNRGVFIGFSDLDGSAVAPREFMWEKAAFLA